MSCVTASQLKAGRDSRQTGAVHNLTFAQAHPIPISGTDDLCLTVGIEYEIYDTGASGNVRYRVRTRGYKHQIVTPDLDEVVLFHWHPAAGDDGKPVTLHPHIHIGGRLLDPGATISRRAHVPSGRVCVEDVVLFLIEECRATPRRPDWKTVLDESRADFRAHASWGTGSPTQALSQR